MCRVMEPRATLALGDAAPRRRLGQGPSERAAPGGGRRTRGASCDLRVLTPPRPRAMTASDEQTQALDVRGARGCGGLRERLPPLPPAHRAGGGAGRPGAPSRRHPGRRARPAARGRGLATRRRAGARSRALADPLARGRGRRGRGGADGAAGGGGARRRRCHEGPAGTHLRAERPYAPGERRRRAHRDRPGGGAARRRGKPARGAHRGGRHGLLRRGRGGGARRERGGGRAPGHGLAPGGALRHRQRRHDRDGGPPAAQHPGGR